MNMKTKFASSVSLRSVAAAALLAGARGASQAAIQSFNVFARQNSTAFNTNDASPLDTGLTFNSGDALNITATGSWDGGACGPVGPEGTNCFGNDPVTGINYFSLIGRVGGGSYFKVGDSFAGTASSSGHLFLAFLDTDSFNNTGFVTARVTVADTTAVPEPQTYALVLGALGVLAFARRKAATRA